MNLKSMLVGFLIAVVASTGTYFLVPPPSSVEASNCATKADAKRVIGNCLFTYGGGGDVPYYHSYMPMC